MLTHLHSLSLSLSLSLSFRSHDSHMARWEKCQHLQGPLLDQMKGVYGPKFPIEVRHYIADWIEHQCWSVR